jgi:peptide/nickel transport system substrate-binding protein
VKLRNATAAGAVLCAVALTLSACGSSSKGSAPTTAAPAGGTTGTAGATSSAPANVTLTVEGNTLAGPISGGFNPFLTGSDAYTLGAVSMMYEPLLQFDILKPGTVYPWLAASDSFSPDGKTLTFHLRPGVTWSDGTPFSSADVVYTFNLMKSNTALNSNGIQFATVAAPDANTVVMTFSAPAYTQLYAIADQSLIVPKHIWQSISSPATFADTNPIGTGPYVLKQLTPQGITLTANTHYWQTGKPQIATLQFPDYQSNDSAASALETGQLQWAGNFVSHVQSVFANTSTHQYYFPPVNTVALWPNLKVWPFTDLAVRRATSLAINRQQVAQEGEQGDEAPATTSTGLILPNDNQFLSDTSTNTLPYNQTQAAQILQSAGYKKVGGVWTSSTGRQVAFSLEDPASYSDYMASIQAIAQQLNQFGFKVSVNGVSANAWNADIKDGSFQATLHWGQTAPTPYGQFENWLDPSLIGGGTGNFEQYSSPQAAQLLNEYRGAADNGTIQSAVTALGGIMTNEVPVIPIMYGASWGEYNSSTIKGWPTASNPYDPVQPGGSNSTWDEYTVLQLHV